MNEAGQVAGVNTVYNGGTSQRGTDTWFYDGSSTQRIGLTGAGYTSSSGQRFASILALGENGQVAGTSNRYIGSDAAGQDLWVWDGSSTQQIGLFGAGYIRDNGTRSSSLSARNASMQIVGQSTRYNGATGVGRDVWVWTGSETRMVGLQGAGYERSDGYRFSQVRGISDAGVAYGDSSRYDILTDGGLGRDAWYHDITLDMTYTLRGDESDTGFSSTIITAVTDEGFALGYYSSYEGDGVTAVRHGFVYRPAIGLVDLGELVRGGLSAYGVDVLSQSVFGDAIEYLIAYGTAQGQTGQAVYLLTPTPGGLGLLAIAGLAASRRRR